jgi:uncharacterized YigZ family protein
VSAGLEGYITIEERVDVERVIKKSRFLCALMPAASPGEAKAELDAVKKEHYNASHNCSAVITGGDRAYMHASDDGEPQGTAGTPMLEALKKSGLTYVQAVVTRYFGGTLLGVGGLSRAYGGAVADAIAKAAQVRVVPADVYRFTVDYADYGKLQSVAAEFGAALTADFAGRVVAEAAIRKADAQRFGKRMAQAFMGADVYAVSGSCQIRKKIEHTDPIYRY